MKRKKPPPTIYTYTTPSSRDVIAINPYGHGRSAVYNVSITGWNCWNRAAAWDSVSWIPYGSTAKEPDAIRWLVGEE